MAGHAYKAAADELDVGVSRDLDAPYRATVLEPIGKLNNYYSTINSAIDKRNHKVSLDSVASLATRLAISAVADMVLDA